LPRAGASQGPRCRDRDLLETFSVFRERCDIFPAFPVDYPIGNSPETAVVLGHAIEQHLGVAWLISCA
jgi:hypothetical protein